MRGSLVTDSHNLNSEKKLKMHLYETKPYHWPLPAALSLQSPSSAALMARAPVIFPLSKSWFPDGGCPFFQLRSRHCLWTLSRWQLLWVPTPATGRTGRVHTSPFCVRCVSEKTDTAEWPKKSIGGNAKSVPGHSQGITGAPKSTHVLRRLRCAKPVVHGRMSVRLASRI